MYACIDNPVYVYMRMHMCVCLLGMVWCGGPAPIDDEVDVHDV